MENSFATHVGSHFDEGMQACKDFVLVARYGTPALSWSVSWCDTNKVFIWHKDCELSLYETMTMISNVTMDEIDTDFGKGHKPFSNIY